MAAEATAKFLKLGIDERSAKEFAEGKLRVPLETIMAEAKIVDSCEKSVGVNLTIVAGSLPLQHSPVVDQHWKTLVAYIMDKRISLRTQVDAAIKFLKSATDFDLAKFEAASGVGVVVTEADAIAALDKLIDSNKDQLTQQRYKFAPRILGQYTSSLPFADGAMLKRLYDAKILEVLGPRTDEDRGVVKKEEKKADAPKAVAASAEAKGEPEVPAKRDWSILETGRHLPACVNTPDQLRRYQEATSSVIISSQYISHPFSLFYSRWQGVHSVPT